MLETIFVFVATEFVSRGEQEFLRLFGNSVRLDQQEKFQQESMKDMQQRFITQDIL